ncbi:unnamed protein product [Nippostrongylus brasiliensis]|uniref:G_PROTEIN_RECEP_F2_3 domain-containing protein n=1 Tax=Nippostrongylus brasiliensis TaxID=27835 RepID=A0A0N4XUU0_NIPBR|nr:unnamed protein product [Nippostrongylus brasiliensis]
MFLSLTRFGHFRATPDYDMLSVIYDGRMSGGGHFDFGRVYYVVCDATVTKFTKYPVTVTSRSRDDMVKVTGKCVTNATPAQSDAPTGFCTSTGRWNHLMGECACKPGFTSDSFDGEDKCIAPHFGGDAYEKVIRDPTDYLFWVWVPFKRGNVIIIAKEKKVMVYLIINDLVEEIEARIIELL